MSNVASLSDFRKRDKQHALQMIDEIRARVENGDLEAMVVIAFDSDMGNCETWLLNICDLDVIESIGALEVAKMQLIGGAVP